MINSKSPKANTNALLSSSLSDSVFFVFFAFFFWVMSISFWCSAAVPLSSPHRPLFIASPLYKPGAQMQESRGYIDPIAPQINPHVFFLMAWAGVGADEMSCPLIGSPGLSSNGSRSQSFAFTRGSFVRIRHYRHLCAHYLCPAGSVKGSLLRLRFTMSTYASVHSCCHRCNSLFKLARGQI